MTTMYVSRLPVKRRRSRPKQMVLTSRDVRIMEAIHSLDGLMSLEQIDRLFFSDKGGSWPRERLRVLCNNGYLISPGLPDRHRVPFGETVYFLTEKGAGTVAALQGLRLADFHWKKKPRWSLIAHDLAVNDFRMAIMQATQASPDLTLQSWVPESEFWSNPDKVAYKNRNGKSKTRLIRPDGFFTIRRPTGQPGKLEELPFLLEIDMATEDNPRFAREKVRPGVAYLKSNAYHERFGVDYGRWLVVTTGEVRLANMIAQTERAGGSSLFYFTTFERISAESVLTQRVWREAGSEELSSIVPQTWSYKKEEMAQMPAINPLAAGILSAPR